MAEKTIPYNPGDLNRNLTAVGGYLAVLRYIDRALAYMDEQEASWWEGISEVSPGDFYMDVELGQTVPFVRKYRIPHKLTLLPWQESKESEINNHLQALAEEASSWAAANIESLSARVKPFTWPRASMYDSHIIDPLKAAHETLEDEVSNDFGKLEHSLGNWEGDAADNFATNFYNPFEHTLRSQKALLSALAGGIVTAKAIVQSTQLSLMNVVHYAAEALHEQLELRAQLAEQARQESKRNILIIAGGYTSIFAAIFTGGLWAIGMATAAGSAAIATTTIPVATGFELMGGTAEEFVNTLTDAIKTIEINDGDQHRELEIAIEQALKRAESLLDGHDDDYGRLIPIRPNIVDGVDGEDFYLP